MRKSKIKNLAAAVAALGFLLLLTERGGLPWAGNYIGAALLILGTLAALRTQNKRNMEGRKAKNEIHLRIHRRPAGRDDAA